MKSGPTKYNESRAEVAARPSVIVVGGGVSGCACAARLAAAGVCVTVFSSSLDVIGLPGFGPVVEVGRAGEEGWSEIIGVLGLVPDDLRWAWLNSASVSESGEPMLVVDRRAVSIETKRALEMMPGLEFRQGLVADVRVENAGAARINAGAESVVRAETVVETVFGETFRTQAVVLCPGLSLKGRVEVGQETLAGGRYGEVPADELYEALVRLGVEGHERTVEVDSRLLVRTGSEVEIGRPPGAMSDDRGCFAVWSLKPARESLQITRGLPAVGEGRLWWPAKYPPSPHWDEQLQRERGNVVVAVGKRPGLRSQEQEMQETASLVADSEGACTTETGMLMAPDGMVTAEVSMSRGAETVVGGEVVVTRLSHRVRGWVANGVGSDGRQAALPEQIRIAGRAAGARNYLESIGSGVSVADSLIAGLWRKADAE